VSGIIGAQSAYGRLRQPVGIETHGTATG
jgi:hypothetical protein